MNVAKSYPGRNGAGEKEVFRNVNFMIERGDRIALVGVNGAGKSTLIKLLAGTEPLSSGEYRLGHNVILDYFAQDQYKELDPDARILDDLGALSPRSTETELRGLLGCFLFSEDDVFKKIGVLSGGERGRYALLRLLLHPANFLLLDEPTNHLDMRAKDVLLSALMEYTGTVVFVSHDRYFIDKLATRVFEIGGGCVEIFPGNYEDYLWRKEGGQHVAPTLDDVPGASRSQANSAAAKQAETALPANGNGSAAEPKKRLNPLKRKQMEDRVKQLEGEIGRAEDEIAQLETALQSFVSAEETQRQSQELEQPQSEPRRPARGMGRGQRDAPGARNDPSRSCTPPSVISRLLLPVCDSQVGQVAVNWRRPQISRPPHAAAPPGTPRGNPRKVACFSHQTIH